ncbi:alpha/beta-hydrolase [Gloeophyllum trabeum ATCC 11539]|uniref:Alpha/beta-hydrolase n=1 Tax=Gloeophyllum trabeum (strain ATCC 11539 / FP-39264 / Madison 617) TaxID=670483 RepID=S7RVP0_GLOTA|nr:alpha/beta-hydrolase [Gloeophyllum trabeum ATCC 11539]EPQ58875.1 alpha/beta-hydrolase [Gloeophyllum trabeum ATCC 11539]
MGNTYHCLTFSLVVLPSVLLTAYFFAQFPRLPQSFHVYPSLASLPPSSRSWSIYPPDFYEGGQYVDLPYGRIRYWVFGPETGKKIVFIHGFSIPAIIWKDVAPELAARGFRVLLFDLYGRGYSDAPQTAYDTALYTTQLALLMQHVKWDKAYIAGVSMGGGIAAAFTATFPDLVDDKIALVCPAGLMDTSDISRTMKFMSSPALQAVTSSSPFRFYLRRLANSTSDTDPIAELVRIQSAYLPGYNPALASSLRAGPLRGLKPAVETLGRSARKVLLVWGTADKVVPYKYSSVMQGLLPNSELVTIEDGPHDLTLTHPKLVTDALLRFFEDASS